MLDDGLYDGFLNLILIFVLLQTFQVLLDDLVFWNLRLQPQLIIHFLLPLLLLFLEGGSRCGRECLTDEVYNLLLLFFHRSLLNNYYVS